MKQFIFFFCFFPMLVQAQKTLSLAECVELLGKNNLLYRQSNLQAEAANAMLQQTKSQIFPQIGLSVSQNMNLGRNLDQYTNTYIDQVYQRNYLGAGFQVPVFQGFKIQNQIRQGQLLKESALEYRTAVLNAQTIVLLQWYVSVLANKALYDAAGQQVASSQQQVDRTEKQVNAGVVGQNVLFEIRAQLSNDRFDQVTALNNYKTALLALFQQMNLPPDDEVKLTPLEPVESPDSLLSAEAIFTDVEKLFPELKSAELSRQSYSYLVKSIKANNIPSLSLGANFGALYATNNKNLDYFQQLNSTRSGSMSLNLNIPIMGRWVTRPRVEYAKVQERLAQNQLDVSRQTLRQSIEKAVLDLNSSSDRYNAAKSQVESLTSAFGFVESKLAAGTANVFEYSLAKANLARAQANEIQARYTFLMQQRLIKYYRQGNWAGVI